MMLQYGLPNYKDENEFLALLAKRQGRLRKGGLPDVKKAALTLLQDWNRYNGKITCLSTEIIWFSELNIHMR